MVTGGDVLGSIQRQQLLANVQHYRSQLRLVQATMLAQKEHIQNLQTEVGLLIDALKAVKYKADDKDAESFFGDTVELRDFEGKGYVIKIPNLVRKLKTLFTKGKE